jgi:hypothetical protein
VVSIVFSPHLASNLNVLLSFKPKNALTSLFVVQLLLNLGLEILGLLGTRPPALDLAIAANEELFKVPLDTLQAHESGLLVLEPFECWVCSCAVDLFYILDFFFDIPLTKCIEREREREREKGNIETHTSILPKTGKLTP